MFIGGLQANDKGGTYFVPSEFYTAFTSKEPTLILLDEITRTPQTASNLLMTILDRNQSYIYNEDLGLRENKGEKVRIVCAGNQGMQYTDTRTMDSAFWDRFIKLIVDYLPPDEEIKLLRTKAPKVSKNNLELLIKRANLCRQAEREGNLMTGVSTRQLIDMAHLLELEFDFDIIFDNVFLNIFVNGSNDEISEVKNIIQGG